MNRGIGKLLFILAIIIFVFAIVEAVFCLNLTELIMKVILLGIVSFLVFLIAIVLIYGGEE